MLGEFGSGAFDPCVGSTGTIFVLRSYPHAPSANAATSESNNDFMMTSLYPECARVNGGFEKK